MSKVIRIGTRDSELALWQAKTVQQLLKDKGYDSELVPVKSTGDLILDKPLYELGITGVFTKTLDVAMLKGEVDIAVHSMKDVPTLLPKGIVEAAVLERAVSHDILVTNDFNPKQQNGTIATGSLRRKAQWLHRYPNYDVVDLRGNVNTRMQKLKKSDWQGAIFAAAGLKRINLTPDKVVDLDWMIPAPAQGAMLVVAMENDAYCKDALADLNDKESQLCVHMERDFLRTLEGGCTAPIGALATIKETEVHFHGALFSLDGKFKLEIERTCSIDDIEGKGSVYAKELLSSGGSSIMTMIKEKLGK